MNGLWRKLSEPRIWRRIYRERLGQPLIYNIASLFALAFGSVRTKIEYDCVPRQPYAYSILEAARLAMWIRAPRVTLVEFGVAAGAGLLNMCWVAEKVSRETGIEFDIVGFDSGTGMPPPRDYRDHPEKYYTGDFPVPDKNRLLAALPRNARIYYGELSASLETARREITAPIAFISIDVDYYWSAKEALDILTWEPDRYPPYVLAYFDDVQNGDDNEYCGELLAIKEFNDNPNRKLAPINALSDLRIFKAIWHRQMYYAHILDHEGRTVQYNANRRKRVVLTNPYI